jgi:hypothetical protein
MNTRLDLTGQPFGRLTVSILIGNAGKRVMWSCRCSCGNVVNVSTSHLRSGHTQSCGCLKSEATSDRNRLTAKHGMYGSREWRSWKAMKDRCYLASHSKYRLYGGRGIRVCIRWMVSFENFFADMGPRPEGTTIDRFPNKDGNYEPGNCRWATASQQNANRRSWAKKLGATMMDSILAEFEE